MALTLVSFNVNGVRSRLHQLQALKEQRAPDLIGIQESKVADADFPITALNALGYEVHAHGQKGHYGVALLTTQPLHQVVKGLPNDPPDAQRRLITGYLPWLGDQQLVVINGYFPQGEQRDHPLKFPAKRAFYAGLLDYLRTQFSPQQPLVVMGDMNVAPLDADIGIGAENAQRWRRSGKCCFLPEEREWLQQLCAWGLHDSFRVRHPQLDDAFSWFDYRSRGFEREPKRGLRIDLMLITAPVRDRLQDAGIDYAIRALDKPSDHCPVWMTLDV